MAFHAVLKHDTPEYVLAMFAAKANDANTHFTAMSWNGVLNTAKLAMLHTAYMIREKKLGMNDPKAWVNQPKLALHKEIPSTSSANSWSDFQKKMGVATWCCLKDDSEALMKEPLCCRNGETKRSMFMMALLMDEFDYNDAVRFREL